jgi:zinc transporter 1
MTKERRLYGVIAIAFTFLIAELVIGFTNNALVLVADAFHITSDLIGYIVSVVCIRLANQGKAGKNPREGFTFGMQRAELLGAAFNGTFLLALGVSIILQAIDRFINPSELENAVLVAIIGGAGIASNVVMLAILGGHNHDHGNQHIPLKDFPGSNVDLIHNTHAHHTRKVVKKSKIDLNIFGVLLHVLGDALNSLAVIISAVVYLKTGWIYMDPLASLFGKIMSLPTRPSSSGVKLSTDVHVALIPFMFLFSYFFSFH